VIIGGKLGAGLISILAGLSFIWLDYGHIRLYSFVDWLDSSHFADLLTHLAGLILYPAGLCAKPALFPCRLAGFRSDSAGFSAAFIIPITHLYTNKPTGTAI
jgi:hypothetical protein